MENATQNKINYLGQNYKNVREELDNKGMAITKTIFNKKIKVGYYENSPIWLECTIEKKDLSTQAVFNGDGKILYIGSTKETIDHNEISKYHTLAISCSNRFFDGQCKQEVKEECELTPELKRILEIWEEWHLNDLQPNCKHQNSFNCNEGDFTEQAKLQSSKCPKGYKYGSKWLVVELPLNIIEEIQELFTTWKPVIKGVAQ